MDDKIDINELGWTAIVITCTSVKVREALEEECKRLSNGGLLPKHNFLYVVDDPGPKGHLDGNEIAKGVITGVGSGGATINALLIAIERLSAFHNHTTINNELVHNSRILVIHHGRTLVHSPGGSAFLRINAEQSAIPPNLRIVPPTLLQHAVWMTTNIGAKSMRGVWVTSLDAFLPNLSLIQPPETEGVNGALVCTVPTSLDHAECHGIVISGTGNFIDKMDYKMPLEKLKEVFPKGIASVISGIVFLSSSLADLLLGLHMQPPLDRCTYYGTDSGIPPLQVSLYFDLLAPLCSGVTQEEYVQGLCGATYAKTANYDTRAQQESRMARLHIWKGLQGLEATFYKLENVTHHYLGSDLPYRTSLLPLLPSINPKNLTDTLEADHLGTNVYTEGKLEDPHGKLYILDSLIGKDVELNCKASCVFSGFSMQNSKMTLELNAELIWQCYQYKENNVVTCYGMDDQISAKHEENYATIFNTKYPIFFQRTGLNMNDLWPQIKSEHQTLANAKLFITDMSDVEQINIIKLIINSLGDDQNQREWMSKLQEWKSATKVSLYEMAENCDIMSMMKQRDQIHLETIKQLVHKTAKEVGGQSFLPLFQYAASSKGRLFKL